MAWYALPKFLKYEEAACSGGDTACGLLMERHKLERCLARKHSLWSFVPLLCKFNGYPVYSVEKCFEPSGIWSAIRLIELPPQQTWPGFRDSGGAARPVIGFKAAAADGASSLNKGSVSRRVARL